MSDISWAISPSTLEGAVTRQKMVETCGFMLCFVKLILPIIMKMFIDFYLVLPTKSDTWGVPQIMVDIYSYDMIDI